MSDEREQWVAWVRYAKHEPAPGWTREDCVKASRDGGPSYYFPGVDIAALERRAAVDGFEVDSGKPATAYRVLDATLDIGASEGTVSHWIRVESTNGAFHGHPISARIFQRYVARSRK